MKKMKNVVLLFTCLMFAINTFGQDKIATFTMSYFEKEPVYDIKASEAGDFYISLHSLDASSSKGGINVDVSDLNKFKAAIDSAKTKYVAWSNVAKENGVNELDKDISQYPFVDSYFWYGNEWHFNKHTLLKIRLKILSSDKHILVVTTGKLQASDNQFIDSDGLALAFLSVSEIDSFLSALDPISVVTHYEEKKKKVDLFK